MFLVCAAACFPRPGDETIIGSLMAAATRTAALALAAATLAVPAAFAATELPAGPPTTPASLPVSSRIIVEWERGVTGIDRVAARADADTTLVRTLGAPAFQLVRPEPGQSVSDALAALRDDPSVRVAVRDGYDVLHATTNDPLFNQLWGLQNLGLGIEGFAGAVPGVDVDAASAWDRTRGSSSVVIADIDSGYRFDAPDLAGVAWTNQGEVADGLDNDANGIVDDVHGADFIGANGTVPVVDGDPTDDDLIEGGHGVHTAGTMGAAGNNGIGISGVAQDVRIMPLRVCSYFLDPNPAPPDNSAAGCAFSAEIAAINYAGAHGARVANMSLGGPNANAALLDAFAHNPQTLFVISAANDTNDNDVTPRYPCVYDPSTTGVPGAIDNIICVAATDQADGLADFSDWGATTVDLGAPGTETLSAYPAKELRFGDNFETAPFGWTMSPGAGAPFARTNSAPLTSFGMSATASAPSTTFSSTSTGVAIPAGYGGCTLTQTRTLSVDGGTVNDRFQYSVLSNGTTAFSSGPVSASGTISTVPIRGLAGTTVQVRNTFITDGTPVPTHGAWIDDVKLECNAPLSTPPTYDYLEGTSMAAPHVTGAAGLLFSLKPTASVAEVRSALLGTVEVIPSLVGKTVTGGRLDVSAALDRLVPPDTAVTSGPPVKTTSKSASFAFTRSDSAVAATFECRIDGAAFVACASPAAFAVPFGSHTFEVRARDVHGNLDATPASYAWRAGACKVPKLKGKTLKQATKALKQAHCKVGKVVKPKKKGHKLPPLVVGSSKPKAGTSRAEDAKVKLTLTKKPKPRKHRR